ncbi:hypothetical protein ACN6KF_001515 [Labrys sp. La1]|uniref:hypothetical protein n=1 Tax=Labrys sp. La1 TaxID=3404917 RepID=UPI003EB74F58
MSSSELAAWVQAFGSIAAIVFAWWQGSRALRIERKSQAETRQAKRAAFVELTESAIQMLQSARDQIVVDVVNYWHELLSAR